MDEQEFLPLSWLSQVCYCPRRGLVFHFFPSAYPGFAECRANENICIQVGGKEKLCIPALTRAARSDRMAAERPYLEDGVRQLSDAVERLLQCEDVDSMRGVEGAAATAYFSRMDSLLAGNPGNFRFETRSRRTLISSWQRRKRVRENYLSGYGFCSYLSAGKQL